LARALPMIEQARRKVAAAGVDARFEHGMGARCISVSASG
jgi:hypothetical protein